MARRSRRPRSTAATPRAVAAAANRAKQQLYRARLHLQRTAGPASRPLYAAGRWARAQRALEQHRARLTAIPGVVALGLAHRRRGGMRTDEPCIAVYVERKKAPHRGRAIPPFVRVGSDRIATDVVALGAVETQALPGDSIGDIAAGTKGSLGVFVRDDLDGSTAFLTAMHVAGVREYPTRGAGRIAFSRPSRLDDGAAPSCGALVRGTRKDVDAALVRFDDAATAMNQLPFGPVRGWRPLAAPADLHLPVSFVGATSGVLDGNIEAVDVFVSNLGLDHAMLVDVNTRKGDSGGLLVDPQGAALGLLVGGGVGGERDLKIFTPIGLVLQRLQCSLLPGG